MKQASRLFVVSIGVAVAALVLGYGLAGLWPAAPVFIILGFSWWYVRRRNQGGAIFFVIFLLAAAAGILIGISPIWSALCLVAALTVWDLEGFIRRLKDAGREEMASRSEATHLRWLAVVNGGGLLLAVIASLVRVRFPFGIALLAILILFVGLSRGLGYLRSKA